MFPIRSFGASLIAAAAFSLVPATNALAQQNYNPDHVLTYIDIKTDDAANPQLVVIAHRGIYAGITGCPENSTCSISTTYYQNVEAIELDVKSDGQGGLWCFHDLNIGRMTNYSVNGLNFNPFINSGSSNNANNADNPLISSLSSGTINSLRLKDAERNLTGYSPKTLSAALAEIRDSYPHMAVLLDIKTEADAEAAARILDGIGAPLYYTVIKGGATTLNLTKLKNHHVAPTFYTGNVDTLAGSCSANGGPSQCSTRALNDLYDFFVSNKPYYDYLELGMKAKPGPLSGLYSALSGQMGIGGFQPVPEYNGAYYGSDGHWGFQPSDYYASSTNFGAETSDNRPDNGFNNSYYRSVITDDPGGLISYANPRGRRNQTAKYY